MISQTVEYALRAVVTLAQNGGGPCTSREISEITQIPLPYLSKIMQGLVRAGMVRSQRGVHGGFSLRKTSDDLVLLDVVNAVEPIKRIHECPLEISSHGANLCPLHRRLDEAVAQFEEAFRTTRLSDLLNRPDSVTPLCDVNPTVPLKTPSRPAAQRRKKRGG